MLIPEYVNKLRGNRMRPDWYKGWLQAVREWAADPFAARPELSEAAFDEEGFYKIGDAVELLDRLQPQKGLLFDGRVGEDFKLVTGTWVHVGSLRM